MTKRFTYLMKNRGRMGASQSSDVSIDRRLTVVRPSFDRRSALVKLCAVLVLVLMVGVGNVWGTTVSKNVSDIYGSVSNGTQKCTLWDDKTLSISVNCDGNNGKVYATGTEWRCYASNDAVITVAVPSGYSLSSVTLTFSEGTIEYDDSAITSGSANSVSGTSAEFTVTVNAKITAFSVTYGSACSNSVTISKGTGTNCTFTLSKSGAQASCDGVSTTVTVSPTSGYGSPSVTQSGASAAPTITGSSNTYTVAYGANTTGTSTINVSCSANNYTITLNTDLTPTSAGTTSITATYNASTNLTSAITKPTKTGWTFGGYYTAKNGGGTQIIDASGNVVASAGGGSTYTDASKNWKYANNITLYAKWTCTVTWSVNGSTSVYSTQTVTYNSSGSKVASIPGPPSPASYCGDKFVGWTTESSVSQDNDTGLGLFTTVSGSPDIKSIGNITFYAVFADYDE